MSFICSRIQEEDRTGKACTPTVPFAKHPTDTPTQWMKNIGMYRKAERARERKKALEGIWLRTLGRIRFTGTIVNCHHHVTSTSPYSLWSFFFFNIGYLHYHNNILIYRIIYYIIHILSLIPIYWFMRILNYRFELLFIINLVVN